MNVRAVEDLLGPGVEDGEHAYGAADEASVVGKVDDGLGRSLHQQGVAVTLLAREYEQGDSWPTKWYKLVESCVPMREARIPGTQHADWSGLCVHHLSGRWR